MARWTESGGDMLRESLLIAVTALRMRRQQAAVQPFRSQELIVISNLRSFVFKPSVAAPILSSRNHSQTYHQKGPDFSKSGFFFLWAYVLASRNATALSFHEASARRIMAVHATNPSLTVQKLLLLAAGGAAGTLLRYALSGIVTRLLGGTFPWGTLAVNVLGCFMIGLLWALTERTPLPSSLHVFVFTGVLGAFTTFSTYGLETFELMRNGEILLGLGNLLASNLVGIGAVVAGFFLARSFLGGGGGV